MRLWTVHPKYLDARGLVALWREALLAQAVLSGKTRGYTRHPQLERFRKAASPKAAIASYLRIVHAESVARGYRFDDTKIGNGQSKQRISVTRGQLNYEWEHLKAKLRRRDPVRWEQFQSLARPKPHPQFRVTPGPVEGWEVVPSANARRSTKRRRRDGATKRLR